MIAVPTALAVIAAGWLGVSWYRAVPDESLAAGTARDTVLQDAQQATVNLNTLDYRRVQEGLTLWEQSATGPLLDEVRVNRARYARVITDGATTTTARVLDGAVAELDERAGTARVLVGVDVTSVREKGEASCLRRRIQLEMRRAQSGWKVDRLAPVGSANPVPGACPPAPLSAASLPAAAQLPAAAEDSNGALLDVADTVQVSGQVRDAVERIFSYDFARLEDNERAAAAVITGAFAEDYRSQFARVRELAPGQQAVVVATVPALAVKVLDGDRAIVVVFIDQQASRGTQGQPLLAAGRLSVTAQRVNGSWKIAEVKPF